MDLNPLGWTDHAPSLRGMTLFSKIWGSHSHQTAIPESDVDYLAVYMAWNRDMLGLSPPPDTVDGEKPDYQVHEVGKFCRLLLKGNPGIVEALFTDRMVWFDPKWQSLVEERRRFLSKRTVEQYLGYTQGQLKKMAHGSGLHTKGGTYNTKWAYHMIRLAHDALRIAKGAEPIVWKEGEELEMLMQIRRGEWLQERVERETVALINQIDALKPWPLPDEGDKVFLNDWLLKTRGLQW